MEILKSYKKLINSNVFKNWYKDNENAYLFMVFTLFEEEAHSFDFIYLNKKKSTSFTVNGKILSHVEDYKDNNPEELDLKKLGSSYIESVNLANEVLQKYSNCKKALRKMVILESKSAILQWNITLFLSSFNTINVRINALNKEIIEHSSKPLFFRDK